MKRLTIALALLVLFSSAANAARDDDFEFAQKLVERKYYDLAKEQFDRIIREASGTEQKANGELGLALLLKAQASDIQGESKRSVDEVLAVFDDAETKFDAFLSTYSNHPKRTEAKFEVGNLLRMKGVYLTRMIEKEPEKDAEFRGMADKAFGNAIDLFSDVAATLKGREDSNWNYQKARYFHAVTNYDRGLIYPDGSAERRNALEEAISALDNFVWDNEDNILGGYAYLFYGLSMAKLGDPDGALELLVTAASNYQVPDPRDNPNDYQIWTELFMQTYYKMGEYCNELGTPEYREFAVAQFEDMVKRVPDVYDRKTGHFALLEYARCLNGLQRYEEAVSVTSKVSQRASELAPTHEWAAGTEFFANQLLNEIIADAGGDVGALLPLDDLVKAASGRMTSRQWDQAVGVFHQVITSSQQKGEEAEYAPQAWMDIGQCYYSDEKFVEAYFAWDHLVSAYPGSDLAGDAAYYRYRAATALHSVTKDPRDEALKKKTRSEFATNYKSHPRSIDLQYYEGADYITDADAKKIEDDDEAAKALYERAMALLEGVKQSSIFYSKAMARRGEVLFKLGKYDEALSLFAEVESYVTDRKNVTTDDEREANRRQARGIAIYYGARCLARQDEWQDVLDRIAGFETTYPEEALQSFFGPVKYERLRALIETDRIAAAEKQALELREIFPEKNYTHVAFSMLGKAYQRIAQEAKDAKEVETWKQNLEKAASYYAYYLDQKDNPTWEEWQTIGIWYRDLEQWEKAEEFLKRALEMVIALVEANPRNQELKDSQDGLMILLTEMLINQQKYTDARDVFEELLIPDPGARERVFQLLVMQEHTENTLKELMQKIRAVPSLMEGLATAYIEIGGSPETYLKALTLLKILAFADVDKRFTEDWWRWKYLTCDCYFRYGVNYKEKAALQNVINLIDQWDTLGVLKNAPQYQEFLKLRQKAEIEKQKLR